MKNLVDPQILATFKGEPDNIKDIVDFLDTNTDISTMSLCKLIDIDPRKIYNWKANQKRKKNFIKPDVKSVTPKAASKKYNRYNGAEKFALVEEYIMANDEGKSRILREYGLYATDIVRWREQIKEASLEALGTRKIRSDKKSEETIRIEKLEIELKEQVETSAKLSTLLVLQKKTFNMLRRED